MDLSMDMKKQLMQMAGMTDVAEFDRMAQKIAGKASEASIKKPKSSPSSPFQGMDGNFLLAHASRKKSFAIFQFILSRC